MNDEPVISRRSFSLAALSWGLAHSDDEGRTDDSQKIELTWSSFQGDARNSGAIDHRGPVESPSVSWTFGGDGPIWGSPVVHDDRLYVGDFGGNAYCLDVSSGTVKWTTEVKEWYPGTPVFVDETVVYAQGYNPSRLIGLDANDGTIRWEVPFESGVPKPPNVYDGDLFVSVSSKGLASYTSTGDQRWFVELEGEIRTIPAIADGTVVVGSVSGLHAVDAESGERYWDYPIETSPTFDIDSSPTIRDGTVFYCGGIKDGTRIVGIDLQDGTDVFEHATDTGVDASPAVTDDHLVVGTWSRLVALDWRENTRLWERPYHEGSDGGDSDSVGNARRSSPIISEGMVYVGTQMTYPEQSGQIYGLSVEDGQTIWRNDVDEMINTSPVIVDGQLYVGGQGGTLYALSEDRSTDWKRFGIAGGGLAALAGAYGVWRLQNQGSADEDGKGT